ncbi:unnamed protein product [Brachionus calyciflorus]|uniref:Integrase catalytic domain-containing protein n=1 Tax=Brachionus calyciflorus TaxID=104777 RepID=A0A814K5M3_9BILA|nr:unnamed protein product [Brachionus calyciflorus]
MDHFSKFHFLWGQEQKCAEEVCEGLEVHVFGFVGLPIIYQSDNGLEFKNSFASKSQGLVEQANRTLERLLAAMMTQLNTDDWVGLLPKIMFNLNTQQSSATKFMAYEIVFNKQPNMGNEKKFAETNFINDQEIEVEIEQEGTEPRSNEPSVDSASQSDENDNNETRTTLFDQLNKRVLEYEVGDKVSVAIPRIDRGGTDLPNLPGVIGRKTKDFYEIVTEYGILNNCLRAGDLEMFNGPLNFD